MRSALLRQFLLQRIHRLFDFSGHTMNLLCRHGAYGNPDSLCQANGKNVFCVEFFADSIGVGGGNRQEVTGVVGQHGQIDRRRFLNENVGALLDQLIIAVTLFFTWA